MSVDVSYTCNTCGLAFGEGEYQREHMKTDWHRYNLKRRVAELPPIPADTFAQKMVQIQQEQNQPAPSKKQVTKKDLKRQAREEKRQEALEGRVDRLHLGRENSFSSVSSLGFSAGEPSREFLTASEVSATETEPELDEPASRTTSRASQEDEVDLLLKEKLKSYKEIPPHVCFMDGHESENVEENVKYLSQKFGLVIPEEDHVADWEGLITYFNEKVGLGNCCLSCGYMGRSLAAVRAHMHDKQHIKIPWDTEEEQAELLDFYDYEYEDEDEEWEDLDDESGQALADDDTTDAESISDYIDPEDAIVNGYELILGSSGVTAGHRSLNRYYKQRSAAPAEKRGRQAVKMIDYRSPGITERAADKMIKKGWTEERKAQYKFNKGRKQQNFQRHFRDPLLQ